MLKRRIKKKKFFYLFFIFLIWLLFFWKFFFKGLLPIPADITVGAYYPWLDYKWGFSTGVPIKNPLPSDIPSLVYPWRLAVVRDFKSGRWPLWNPAYFLGMPLLANFQSAALSLSNIFFLFLREPLAWGLGVVFQSLLSLLAMRFYLKNKKLSDGSSLLGAVVFSFSGFAVVWHQYNVHGWTMLFLPLILLFSDKYFRSKKNFWLFLLSLAVAFQIFSGYVPIVIYSWLIVGSWLIFRRRIFSRNFWPWLLFVFLGLGIASIQILPGVELVKLSIHKIDPIAEAGGSKYLPLRNLITLAIPNFFGNPATGNFWGKPFYDNFAFWVGALPLLLAIFALSLFKKKKEVVFWLAMIGLGFCLSFNNPIGNFLAKILFLEGGISARAVFLIDFSLAVLAAFGLDFLVKEKQKRRFVIVGFFLVLLIVLAGFFACRGASIEEKTIALRNSVVPLFSLVLVGGLTLFSFRLKKWTRIFPAAFLVLTIFSLWYPARKYWSFVPEKLIFPRTPVIDFLKSQPRPFRFEPGNVIPQNMWMPYNLETVSGYDTLLPKKQGEFLRLVETGHIPNRVSRVQLLSNYQSNLFPFLNVKYFLAKKVTDKGIYSPQGRAPAIFKNPRFNLVFADKTVEVYEDRKALPRFWFSSGKGTVKILDYLPGRERLRVKTDKKAVLVESAAFYPGWKAKLDGKAIEIVEKNNVFRSYLIPQGDHDLEIFYSPNSFKIGLVISLISLGTFLVFVKRRNENSGKV